MYVNAHIRTYTDDLDVEPYSGKLQQKFYDHQHPPVETCRSEPYLIWEPWGIVG